MIEAMVRLCGALGGGDRGEVPFVERCRRKFPSIVAPRNALRTMWVRLQSKAGLVTAAAKESYGMCFIGKRRFEEDDCSIFRLSRQAWLAHQDSQSKPEANS